MLVRRVVARQPFDIIRLPATLRLARYADARRGRNARRWLTKLSKSVFRTAHQRLGLGAEGTLRLDRGDGAAIELTFDGRNTHYGHLYRGGENTGYEPATAALLDTLAPDDGVFYDIGANWGFFSLLIASRPGFRGAVHAFEPLAEIAADLESLVSQAGLAERVHCHQIALSDRTGGGTMDTGRGVHSALARLGNGGGGDGEKVETRRLDDLSLAPPELIKIDVEGHEARLIEGGRGLLETARPAVVFETWHRPDAPPETLAPFELLQDLGYAFFRPGWLGARGEFLGEGEFAPVRNRPATLALAPLDPKARLDLKFDFNALAIHRDRLDALETLFGDS